MRKTVIMMSVLVLLLSPLSTFAQSTLNSTSSTATSTQNSNSGGSSGIGTAIGIGIGIGAAAIGINALSQRATGVSFGGRIVTVIPCSGGMLHITIVPAGLFPVAYIWTPLTITYSAGIPRNPGQQVLGRADIPFVCFIGGGFFSSPIPLFGLRMQTVGTSPAF